MKKSRRLIESGIVTAALAITAAAAAVSGDVKDTSQSNKQADNETIFLAENKNAVNAEAKIAVAAADNSQEDKENKEKQNVTAELLVEKDAGFVQSAATDGVEDRAVVDSQGEVADTMFFTVEQRNKVEDHLNSGLAMETQEEKKEKAVWFPEERIDNPNTHGTGCTLSSAVAANLAKGFPVEESVKKAKAYISGAIRAMLNLGQGNGPLNHMWDL